MKIYKWNKLTNEAAYMIGSLHNDSFRVSIYGLLQQVEQHRLKEKIKNWRKNAKEIILKAQEIIDNWDIRNAGKLFEIFPSIISKKYHNKPFSCEYDEKGNWVIVFGK